MKRLFLIFVGALSLVGLVVYWGNVLVIGEALGRFFGGGGASNPYVMYAWDAIVGLGPFLLLGWVVVRNILGYGELNLQEVCEGEDKKKVDRVMSDLCSQGEEPDCMLDRFGMRDQGGYLLRNGTTGEKVGFLRDYFRKCDHEARKTSHQYAIFAAVSVVLSPKSAGDTLALLVWQCRIISATLRIYGGRPRAMSILRLYARVLMHSFMVGSIDEVLDQFAFGAVDNAKILSIATQAIAAIATCVRTASLTRYYLEHGVESSRKEALHASMKEIPGEILEVLASDELKNAWERFLHCTIEVSKAAGKCAWEGTRKWFKNVISFRSSEQEDEDTGEVVAPV